jgi:RimJ/RimL family protein N-acetyltransferase
LEFVVHVHSLAGKGGAYINTALEMRENAGAIPFIISDKQANTIIGCTRYFNVDEVNQRLEFIVIRLSFPLSIWNGPR